MQKEVFLKKLGKSIVKIRKSKGLSQTNLAVLSNKKRQSIERVENGKTNPTSFYLNEIARALEVPVCEFFEFAESD